jgi:transposase
MTNYIVDSSAIEVNRRQRRAKSDALDVRKLVTMLIRYQHGERNLWSVVRVPSLAEEDQRQLHREIHTLKQERTRTSNRMKGLLSAQGLRLPQLKHLPVQLASVRLWDGSPVPAGLWRRLERDYAHYTFLVKQLREAEAERRALVRTSSATSMAKVRQLMQLRGIGINGAWVCVMEFFGWRQFANRREVASLAGLTPTPYQSGGLAREQGISKAGNRHVRWLMIELAWCWVRYQPESAITRWYLERFYDGGSRARRIGLVAVARKLLIALWRFLETGELPEGATLKSECPKCPSGSLEDRAPGAGERRELPSDAGAPSGSPLPSRSGEMAGVVR